MSEEKLITPLLDGFLMGSPMGEHNGVSCCPAMKEDSDHKYIVKIISVPASQKQLDALLLAGAYRKPEEAVKYFKELADGIVAEAQCLQDLSKLEGFLPYEGWQVEPMEKHDIGFKVYLLGSYKRSLEKHMRRTMLTHLEAINLGLDLCSALATVRRAGYIYADLKPTNIFLEDKACRIGDLGFISLDAFRYTALPAKYVSRYTPPELADPMADLNETIDTYALGMVLYQIYNDGQLPKEPEDPAQGFPTPVNADYELAEIILKALSPKVEDRWKDPQEMGKALAEYLQRNSVNETPVTPPSTVIYDPADMVKEEPEQPEQAAEAPEAAEAEEETAEEASEEAQEAEPTLEQIQQDVQQELETEIPADETAPTAEDAPAPEEQVPLTQETTDMVAQADELLSHEIPEPAQFTEPQDFPEGEENADPFAAFLAGQEDWTPEPAPAPESEEFLSDPIYQETHSRREKPPKKEHKALKIVSKILVVLIILGLIGGAGYYYYANIYLQHIDDLIIEGSQTGMTVTVKTDIDTSDLVVSCIDTYGNSLRQPLVNGSAQFLDLLPDSMYRIQLETNGKHRLVGDTRAMFTTDARTSILQFNAAAGNLEGEVVLDFTVDGPEPAEWTLICSTEGEEPREEIFSGHSVTVKGLTLGKTYTFQLETDDKTEIIGENRILQFTVAAPVTAENLKLSAEGADGLKVTWDVPEGQTAASWTVHCFNESGFDESQSVTGNSASFTGIDLTTSYIVEVTAEGMSQPVRASISANPITLRDIAVDDSVAGQLTVTWKYSGEAPADGWLLSYGIDSNETQAVVPCTDASAVISPRVPGATYHFVIQTAAGDSIFSNTLDYTSPEAPEFKAFGVSAQDITAKLTRTPKDPDWNASSLTGNSYRDTFIPGERVSMVLHANRDFYLEKDTVSALYVLRDESGKVLSKMVTKEELIWNDLWMGGDYHDAELDLPVIPFQEGKYSITVYFNESFLASAEFTIEKE